MIYYNNIFNINVYYSYIFNINIHYNYTFNRNIFLIPFSGAPADKSAKRRYRRGFENNTAAQATRTLCELTSPGAVAAVKSTSWIGLTLTPKEQFH